MTSVGGATGVFVVADFHFHGRDHAELMQHGPVTLYDMVLLSEVTLIIPRLASLPPNGVVYYTDRVIVITATASARRIYVDR